MSKPARSADQLVIPSRGNVCGRRPFTPLSRYKELLNWVEAILSAQGLDQQAVGQALLRLSAPVKMDNLRPEAGGEDLAGGSAMELERTGCSRSVQKPSDVDLSFGHLTRHQGNKLLRQHVLPDA